MAKDARVNPFDLLTEDNEVGIRVPIGQTPQVQPTDHPEVVLVGPDGDEEIIYF